MSYARVLILSLVPLLATIWLIANLRDVEKYVDFIRPFFPVAAPAVFDARLYPERHAQRPAKTIELDWVIRNEVRFPDGVQKSIYTVNGLFPGPTIEARSGDRIILRVRNGLEEETTAIHFHGIRHIGSNSMDGTPGLTQCAIQPKHSFLYNFTINANQSGTYWWHSHSLSQRADGLFGAFVIHDPPIPGQVDADRTKDDLRIRQAISSTRLDKHTPKSASFSERIVLTGDWYHSSAEKTLKFYQSLNSFGIEPAPENALFNGVNTFNCSRASRFVHCDDSYGKKPSLSLDLHAKTRLRLVNTGSLADLEVSLDSHALIVIEADGSHVAPRRVNSVIIAPGQRYSVILEPHAPPRAGDTFWLRLGMSDECFQMPNIALDTEQFYQVFYGASPDLSTIRPIEAFVGNPELENFNALSLAPLHRSPLPKPDQQLVIYINSEKLDRLGGVPYGFVNHTSWKPDQREPLLLKSTNDRAPTEWGKDQLVVTTHRNEPSVVELIINNMDEGPHPFHLHGHHFYPLLVHQSTFGWGLYNHSAPRVEPDEAPVLRDTLVIPRRGHAVIRFVADAPGMWLFHCHVMVHLGTGMAMTFNVRPDLVSSHERQVARESCIHAPLSERCDVLQCYESE